MSLFIEPTPEELRHLDVRANALRRGTHRFVRPLCVETAEGAPDQVGSCVLVEVGARKFLLTSAHVLDHSHRGRLFVGGDGSFVHIDPPYFKSGSPDKRHEDPYDVAFVEISDVMQQELGGCAFAGIDRMSFDDVPTPDAVYIVVGYPARHVILDYPNKKHKPELLTFSLAPDLEAYRLLKVNAKVRIALQFQLQKMKRGAEIRRPKHPEGISGGAIFRLDNPWDRVDMDGDRIVAITTEFKTTPRSILVGARIPLHLAGIASEFPELGDAIPVDKAYPVTAVRRREGF